MDAGVKATLAKIPLLTERSGPRDPNWVTRLQQELTAVIEYVTVNKQADNDWFQIECNKNGTTWTGSCWYYYNNVKYTFALRFDIPVTYPEVSPELELPELDGLTPKMYRGGKICLTDHFKPLWARNVPKFGIAHALALGLGPWLAAEVPVLADSGKLAYQEGEKGKEKA
eukprot:comp9000_c0_seq1/m.10222 comp9000_c0_seq1/g.10222  ORF comp9000_c0_seq1/g.10222 comp9000_c0_seq1/m.10222 type:complete len:170 (+) comp9000_c0_seq1:111-620(+)